MMFLANRQRFVGINGMRSAVRFYGQKLTKTPAAEGESSMLHYAVVFLIIALIAGAFGFWGTASTATQIAQVLFFLFLIMFVASLLLGRRTTPV